MGNTYTHIIAEQEYRKQLWREKFRVRPATAHPFQIWAEKYFYIDPEHTLRLNHAQRILLNHIELKRHAGEKVRLLVPHAKNLGITTFCEAYIYWLQNIERQPGNAAFVYPCQQQHIEAQRRFLDNARGWNNPLNISRVRRLSRSSLACGKNSVINSYRTVRTAYCLRNLSPQYALIASAGQASVEKMTDEISMGFRREPLYAAYLAADSAAHPQSILIIEGNTAGAHEDSFWRETLLAADAHNFTRLFIPWHESEQNFLPLQTSVKDFYNTLDDYEYTILWTALRLSLEQINWYRAAARNVAPSLMRALYPSTPAEALQLDGTYTPLTRPVAHTGRDEMQPRHKQESMHTRCETTHTPNIHSNKFIAKNYTLPGVAFSTPITSSVPAEANFSAQSEKLIGSTASVPVCDFDWEHKLCAGSTASVPVSDLYYGSGCTDLNSDSSSDSGLNSDSYSNSYSNDPDLFSKNTLNIHSISPAETPLLHVTTNIQNSFYSANKFRAYFTDNLNFNENNSIPDYAPAAPSASAHNFHAVEEDSGKTVQNSDMAGKMATRLPFLIGNPSYEPSKANFSGISLAGTKQIPSSEVKNHNLFAVFDWEHKLCAGSPSYGPSKANFSAQSEKLITTPCYGAPPRR